MDAEANMSFAVNLTASPNEIHGFRVRLEIDRFGLTMTDEPRSPALVRGLFRTQFSFCLGRSGCCAATTAYRVEVSVAPVGMLKGIGYGVTKLITKHVCPRSLPESSKWQQQVAY
jgi:hypothetical protein